MTNEAKPAAGGAAAPADADGHPIAGGAIGEWLMLVRTRSTDSAREHQFNDWYDNIDIPDVLQVPGYMRARRGMIQPPDGECANANGKYIALYDILSDAIDKTIIEMLMATRKMEERGRSTDLLEVTERAYYRRTASSHIAPGAAGPPGELYLLLERFDADSAGTNAAFDDWYEKAYRSAIDDAPGAIRATRYGLYRVLMNEPKSLPAFLTIYEIRARSPQQAREALSPIANAWRSTASRHPGYKPGDTGIFLQIREETRVGQDPQR